MMHAALLKIIINGVREITLGPLIYARCRNYKKTNPTYIDLTFYLKTNLNIPDFKKKSMYNYRNCTAMVKNSFVLIIKVKYE